MRTLLICHDSASLDRDGLSRWLASFSDYRGTLVIRESGQRRLQRIKREIQRVGALRFLDVMAFRAYYALRHAEDDHAWEERKLKELRTAYPAGVQVVEKRVTSPNSAEAEAFLQDRKPDLVIARCKTLLAERIFSIPSLGTYVMHPGICPEYRNAHGCFWALTRGDSQNVGMTLLRIDKGVDTGPVFGYFRVQGDLNQESHIVIQHRTVFDNLDAIRQKLLDIEAGQAKPIPTAGRSSATWGQPWLSAYFKRGLCQQP
jgi:hypothetical protein